MSDTRTRKTGTRGKSARHGTAGKHGTHREAAERGARRTGDDAALERAIRARVEKKVRRKHGDTLGKKALRKKIDATVARKLAKKLAETATADAAAADRDDPRLARLERAALRRSSASRTAKSRRLAERALASGEPSRKEIAAAARVARRKPKQKCCRKTTRCLSCPVVVMRMQRAERDGVHGADLARRLITARIA